MSEDGLTGPTVPDGRNGSPGPAETALADAYVTDLLRDAKLVADFGLRAGLFDDGRLYMAIAKVEEPPGKKPYSPEVVELQKAMNKASEVVPFSTLVALRSGWRPGVGGQATARLTALIVFALLAMWAVGSFSQTYNRGVVLLTELQAISVVDPGTRYGQLVRQLVASRKEMSEASANAENNRLSREAYFQNFDELQKLDLKISSLFGRVENFKQEGKIEGISWEKLNYYFYYALSSVGYQTDEGKKILDRFDRSTLPYQAQYTGPQGSAAPLNVYPADCPTLKQNDDYIEAQANYIRQKIGGSDEFIKLTKEFSYEKAYLGCFERFSIKASFMSDIDNWIRDINGILAPYNLWLLPALFGALGAMIFHLRQIAQPLEPNPSAWKITYRVTFGALAGMALAWLWVPEVRFGVDLPNIGFGLFAMAFIVGFSLDVFFTMLDRFVALANTAVGNIGASRTAPS